MIINFEGIDHSFKETNSKKLVDKLHSLGYKSTRFSFPDYNSIYGKKIKSYLKGNIKMSKDELFLLFNKDKFAKVDRMMELIIAGYIIILDRFKYSNLAYNYGLCSPNVYKTESYLPEPDITIYLNTNLDLIKDLIKKRAEDNGEKLDLNESNFDYLKEVQTNYDKVFKNSNGDIYVVNVFDEKTNMLRSEDDIFKDIMDIVSLKLPQLTD